MTLRPGIPVDHQNSDGVRRHLSHPAYLDFVCEPGFNEPDTALAGYFDTPRPANDNSRVYRSVKSGKPYHCYNSTSWKYTDIALPRISMIDGPHADDKQVAA